MSLTVEKAAGKKKTGKIILAGLLVFVLIFSVGSMIFVKGFYDQNFPRFDAKKYSGFLRYEDVSGYNRTIIHIKSGQNTLTGSIYGEANDKGLVIIAPGLGESAERFLNATLFFVNDGWRVLSFDYTGSFESEGQSTVGLPQSLIDLRAVLTWVEKTPQLNELPIVLYGHSWGGYAVAAILNDDDPIAAVASISGFNSPDGLLSEQLHNDLGLFGSVEYPFAWLYQTLLFGKNASVTAVAGINHRNTPVMIIHGDHDQEISYQGASIIAQRNRITDPNAVFITESQANHNGHNDLYESEAARVYKERRMKIIRY